MLVKNKLYKSSTWEG